MNVIGFYKSCDPFFLLEYSRNLCIGIHFFYHSKFNPNENGKNKTFRKSANAIHSTKVSFEMGIVSIIQCENTPILIALVIMCNIVILDYLMPSYVLQLSLSFSPFFPVPLSLCKKEFTQSAFLLFSSEPTQSFFDIEKKLNKFCGNDRFINFSRNNMQIIKKIRKCLWNVMKILIIK